MAWRLPSRWRRFGHCDRGSSLVEFAASGGILFTFLIGTMNVCRAVYTYHYVSESVRETTRYAAVRGSACVSYATACPASSSDIQSYMQNLNFPGINGSLMSASTTWAAYPTGGTCTPSTTCNNPGNMVTVKATYAFPLSIPYLKTVTLNMTSTSAMVISQ